MMNKKSNAFAHPEDVKKEAFRAERENGTSYLGHLFSRNLPLLADNFTKLSSLHPNKCVIL